MMIKPVAAGLLNARSIATKASFQHEDEYASINDLKIKIDRPTAAFFMCFWIYIPTYTSPAPAILLRQMYNDVEENIPFLVLNTERKMVLFPFVSLLGKAPLSRDSTSQIEIPSASTEVDCPFNRWVHIGCEVSFESVHLYMDGVMMGEKSLLSLLRNGPNLKDVSGITVCGAKARDGKVLAYVHYVRFILPQKSAIQDHIIKNPPTELCIDTSGITDIEEDEDGIWSIVGGEASCRRNLNLDVILIDGLGNLVNKEIEVVASLIFADDGTPVDGEAPLLISYDGTEFSSLLRPHKLLHGRLSLKLKISQLSSKCENRLFRVRFNVPTTRRYPFFVVYTNPIRCISRSHNTHKSSVLCNKSISVTHLQHKPQLMVIDDGSQEAQPDNEDCHHTESTTEESKCSLHPKSVNTGAEKLGMKLQADPKPSPQYEECNSRHSNTDQVGYTHGEGVKRKPENLEGTNNTLSDSESVQARETALKKVASTRNAIPDLTMFKYCLGSICERSLILKEVATIATDQEMLNFAQQVSFYTGCSHQGYPIWMAKRLLQEGSETWNLISEGNSRALWKKAAVEIGEQFKRLSRCNTRGLRVQDLDLLKRIAGCQEYMNRESFDKMWSWLYPVAFTLSREGINKIWGRMSTLLIEGLITKEEAEASLQSAKFSQQPGTFVLRFPTTRSWPHPDAGSLVVTYVGHDLCLHNRLLNLDYREIKNRSLEELLVEDPHLKLMVRGLRPRNQSL